jgi:HEAT repeat protein
MEAQEDVKGLIKALRHRDWETVGAAAAALGRIGDVSAVNPLIRVLDRHPSPGIRQLAAGALGKIGSPQAF